jgi:CheY-like chemotaxis protein
VLIVDDNEDSREILAIALRNYGAATSAVASATEALALIGTTGATPDVLVSDVGMADVSGYDLIRHIRSSPIDGVRNLPAIAVTAYANPEDRIRALVAGFQAHLPKPIDPAVLASSISAIVNRGPKR